MLHKEVYLEFRNLSFPFYVKDNYLSVPGLSYSPCLHASARRLSLLFQRERRARPVSFPPNVTRLVLGWQTTSTTTPRSGRGRHRRLPRVALLRLTSMDELRRWETPTRLIYMKNASCGWCLKLPCTGVDEATSPVYTSRSYQVAKQIMLRDSNVRVRSS